MSKKLKSLEELSALKLPGEKPGIAQQVKQAVKAATAKGRPLAAAKPGKAAPGRPGQQPAPAPEILAAEDSTFYLAMQGVTPMKGTGRQVQPAPPPPPPAEPEDGDDADSRLMRQAMQGAIEFELELSDEYMHGYVRGLDSKIFQQLKAGSLSTEGHLDLHGQNADQAYDSLLFFMRESYLAGKRAVVVVPGRGRNSPGGLSVLRQEIQSWLTREPLRRIVLAFCTAQPRDGGAGALYILLRKVRKSIGKVAWDKQMNWEDLER